MNILYVENHAVFAATVVGKFLPRHTVTVVTSLVAAREALALNAFEIVSVDYDLDDGKGDELVCELRSHGTRTVVIGVSSHEEGNTALLRAGASAVCGKAQFDQIQNVIDGVMKGS